MTIVVTILHVLICLFLIFVVLIQGGRGAELGAAFGGSSQTLFGSRGAATFLGKLTTAFAALFMVTSMVLTLTSMRGRGSILRPSAAGRMPARQMPFTPQPPGNVPPAGPAGK
ncbi:MAG: preprotein translocase subunit SecG [Nitrospiraceae bacterium]|nr:preprotein translocase subunit SecG [Nitrospiraceae bacterium]